MSSAPTPKKSMWERVKDRWNYAKAHPWEINLGRAVKTGLLTGGAIGGGILLAPALLKILSVAIPGITHLIDGVGNVAGDVLQVSAESAQHFSGGVTEIAQNIAASIPPADLTGARDAIAGLLDSAEQLVRP